MNIETANRLLQYRKKFNLSQEELAAKIGVSRQAISKWERAEASPDTDNLILLADIYGVSLDELLKGESKKEDTKENDGNPDNDEKKAEAEQDEKISFKNGIHIHANNGDKVDLSFKDGVHVTDNEGAKVHVGWDGISVEENGEQKVYTDENGHVIIDESMKHHKHKEKGIWLKFPFFIFALIGFIAWGFSGVCFGWALSWICLLTIPIYYTLVEAIYKRKPNHFAYPVLVVMAYILFGFFNVFGGWSVGWIVFLTIPIYYWICDLAA